MLGKLMAGPPAGLLDHASGLMPPRPVMRVKMSLQALELAAKMLARRARNVSIMPPSTAPLLSSKQTCSARVPPRFSLRIRIATCSTNVLLKTSSS
jgi:hypothetical protein